ncbi:peptide deformylase [Actinomadura craniellae]|uniref:Peptide deformylase n=1 Tax=Actinomadura craniellae TaxID=2231787 RepID=A0A365HD41_9ACTN|nr:peptide deformylase [Actinomadura craniellae]RAY16836.1 peptide deformylase [Actinomadura craniellae]
MTGVARPITLVGTPVLHRPCRPVERFDADLARLTEDMFASMYAAQGVGLAANQIGVDLRVFVYDCPDAGDTYVKGVIVNPTLELPAGPDRELDDSEEGCLSVPGARAAVPRPDRARCHGFDLTGAPVTVTGTGLLARCLQHETDHLDGRLYVDHLNARTREQVLSDFATHRAAAFPPGPAGAR